MSKERGEYISVYITCKCKSSPGVVVVGWINFLAIAMKDISPLHYNEQELDHVVASL